jgi:hypothetical protein
MSEHPYTVPKHLLVSRWIGRCDSPVHSGEVEAPRVLKPRPGRYGVCEGKNRRFVSRFVLEKDETAAKSDQRTHPLHLALEVVVHLDRQEDMSECCDPQSVWRW